MDSTELRNRLMGTALAAAGAMAISSTLLSMFQDSADAEVASAQLKLMEKHSAKKVVIPQVGTGADMLADFVKALCAFAEKSRSASTHGMGWVDNWGAPVLLLSKPEHCRLLLSKITAHALWGGLKPASEAFFGKSVLFVLEGEEWKRLRGILRDSFKVQKLEVMYRDVTSCAFELTNRLQEFAESQASVDMENCLAQYHLACVGKSSFNYDMNVLQKFPAPNEISQSFEYLLQELPRRSFHPDVKVQSDYTSATEDNMKWQHASKTVRSVVTKTIELRLHDRNQTGWVSRGDLLDSMIDAYYAAQNPASSSMGSTSAQAQLLADVLGDNLVEIFFAGFGTSVVAMSVALYNLATNKELMHQAHEEVDDVDMESPDVSLSAKQFPFLCRVFQEALRICPPAPLVARLTTEPLEFDGVSIPSGTNVWIPCAFLHSDAQSWGSSVDKFDPSRWEGPVKPGSFLPFSYGARDCIGKHFAELESVVAMAVMLKSFDFEVAPGYEFTPFFTGFGNRVADKKTMKVCCNLIPKRRQDVSAFIYDWTPGKLTRKNSANPLFQGETDDMLSLPIPPPKF